MALVPQPIFPHLNWCRAIHLFDIVATAFSAVDGAAQHYGRGVSMNIFVSFLPTFLMWALITLIKLGSYPNARCYLFIA